MNVTNGDYWLFGLLFCSYYALTFHKIPIVKKGFLWLYLWIVAIRLSLITKQVYFHFLSSDAYRLNNKQEESWILALMLLLEGILFFVIAPVAWFYQEWRQTNASKK